MILPPIRQGTPATGDLLARRARMPVAWTPEMLEPGTVARDAVIAGIPCLICESASPLEGEVGAKRRVGGDAATRELTGNLAQAEAVPPTRQSSALPTSPSRGEAKNQTILYFHGGGYRMGTTAAYANFGTRLAAVTGYRIVVADYRLAPEHPFPAGLTDALAVYDALVAEDGEAPVVGGDSAGGGMAAAIALAAEPKPRKAVLLSPWIDLTVTNPAYESRTADLFFPRASAAEAAGQYLQGYDPQDPLVSPLTGDLSGYPPTLILASADECLVGDALAFQAALTEARRPVETHIVPGMTHVWPVIAPALPESEAAMTAIANFVRS